MDLNEALCSRRTIHIYENIEVPSDLLEEALAKSLLAPNHKNTEPWRFAILGEKTKEQILQLNLEAQPEISNSKKEKLERHYRGQQSLVVLGCRRGENQKESEENYASIACGIQNISLFLWSKGYGCKWSTGKIVNHPELSGLISWSPAEIKIVGFLWVGKAKFTPPAPKRQPIGNYITSCP